MKKISFAIWLLMVVPCFAQEAIVLRTGEVTAEMFWVDAFADVVYRGDHDKPTTADGKIKDIGRNTFTIGKGFWKEVIAFENVDRIILGEERKLVERLKAKLEGKAPKMRSDKSVVTGQILMGGALCIAGGFFGAIAGVGLGDEGFADIVPAGVVWGTLSGMALGSAVGVTLAGRSVLEKPIFARALAGSILGMGLGMKVLSGSESTWPVLFIAPPVLATSLSWLGNERKYNAVTFDVGLLPQGGQRVVATWHF